MKLIDSWLLVKLRLSVAIFMRVQVHYYLLRFSLPWTCFYGQTFMYAAITYVEIFYSFLCLTMLQLCAGQVYLVYQKNKDRDYF